MCLGSHSEEKYTSGNVMGWSRAKWLAGERAWRKFDWYRLSTRWSRGSGRERRVWILEHLYCTEWYYCQCTFQRAHFQERLFILQKVPVTWYWYSSDTCLLMEKGSGGKVRSFFPEGGTCLAVTEEQQGSSWVICLESGRFTDEVSIFQSSHVNYTNDVTCPENPSPCSRYPRPQRE